MYKVYVVNAFFEGVNESNESKSRIYIFSCYIYIIYTVYCMYKFSLFLPRSRISAVGDKRRSDSRDSTLIVLWRPSVSAILPRILFS